MSTLSATEPFHDPPISTANDLVARYNSLEFDECLSWVTDYRKLRLLGAGGQGVVYLSERHGADDFKLPAAIKIFSPKPYRDRDEYADDMKRIAQTAVRVALIQHDNVLDVHNFIEQDGIRIMAMEWVDGFDVGELLKQRLLDDVQKRLNAAQRKHLNNVIITSGPTQPRLKSGIALQVLRECLAGLAALHRNGIVHGDLKPANIMLKRTGNVKIIDMGSAVDLRTSPRRRFWSPAYAAPEVLRGEETSFQSDIASLGYVFIEMLSGQTLFAGLTTYDQLMEIKQQLVERLPKMLPHEVKRNDLLLQFCERLIAPDPSLRFPSAETADLGVNGAASLQRQLVLGNLDSEYENDIRVWLEHMAV